MPTTTRLPPTVVRPRFMAGFRCLGADCPDDCCHGWAIDVDDDTRRRFRRHGDAAWRRRFREAVAAVRDDAGRSRHVMRLRPDGRCPFLDEDRLCAIHKVLGEQALPATCRLFPRTQSSAGSVVFEGGSLACPRVARDVVEDPDALADVVEGEFRATMEHEPSPSEPDILTPHERVTIRSTFVQVLTRPQVPWAARVALALVFLQALEELDWERERQRLLAIACDVRATLDAPDLSAVAALFADGEERLAKLVAPILRTFLRHLAAGGAADPRRRRMIETVWGDLLTLAATAHDLGTAFRRAIGEYVVPAFEAAPHIPGNVVAALLLQRHLPGERVSGLRDGFWTAAFLFALWRFVLALRLARGERPFREEAVTTLYRTSRYFLHNAAVIGRLRESFAAHGSDRLPQLALLLR